MCKLSHQRQLRCYTCHRNNPNECGFLRQQMVGKRRDHRMTFTGELSIATTPSCDGSDACHCHRLLRMVPAHRHCVGVGASLGENLFPVRRCFRRRLMNGSKTRKRDGRDEKPYLASVQVLMKKEKARQTTPARRKPETTVTTVTTVTQVYVSRIKSAPIAGCGRKSTTVTDRHATGATVTESQDRI